MKKIIYYTLWVPIVLLVFIFGTLASISIIVTYGILEFEDYLLR